jgi:hypothetical protein
MLMTLPRPAATYLPDATPADRVTVVPVAGLWPVTAGGAP